MYVHLQAVGNCYYRISAHMNLDFVCLGGFACFSDFIYVPETAMLSIDVHTISRASL